MNDGGRDLPLPGENPEPIRILALSTLGSGSNEENRILELLSEFRPEVFPFDRSRKIGCFRRLVALLASSKYDLVVLEGTGLAGGMALMIGRVIFGNRYAVSSGDAVGPWVSSKSRLLGPIFGIYERLLCRWASGFIGWTPYLVGRALTFGTPRAMTAAGWAPFTRSAEERARDRKSVRNRLGISSETLVVGIAGSLVWSKRRRYCYGWELVRAALTCRRDDVCWLIVGDGSGRERLEKLAADVSHGRVVFTGRVPQETLPEYYAAMDVGSLPQSVDSLGSFRYTTKVSEYLAFRIPILTGEIPLAYDFTGNWLWCLGGNAPWEAGYCDKLARLVEGLSPAQIRAKSESIPYKIDAFDRGDQVERATRFVRDLVAAGTR